MKKTFVLLLVLSLIFALSACGQKSSDAISDSNKAIESTEKNDKLNSITFVDLCPNEETTYPTTILVLADDAWLEYSITYNQVSESLVVGLRADDGKEYSVEVTDGTDSGKVTDIPKGSYTIFVRNSSKNSVSTDTTSENPKITGCMSFVLGATTPDGVTYFGKG